MFAGGWGSGGSLASLTQTVNILGGAQGFAVADLDAGKLKVEITFYYQNYYYWALSTDTSQVIVTFLSATNTSLGSVDSTTLSCGSGPGWCLFSTVVNLPIGTRSITYTMKFNRNGGNDNDAYIDDNSLRII